MMKKLFLFAVMVVVSLSAHCQIEELQKRANKGDAEAQCKLGRMYDDLDTAMHDYAKAHLWYTKAANQGNAEAQLCRNTKMVQALGRTEKQEWLARNGKSISPCLGCG